MSDELRDAISASIKELSAAEGGEDDTSHEEADDSKEELQGDPGDKSDPAGDKPPKESAEDETKDEQGREPKAEKADKPGKKSRKSAAKGGGDAPKGDDTLKGGEGGEGEGSWDHNKAPQGWSPSAREKWATLPEDIRKEITRREEASAVGVRQIQERFAPVQQFARDMTPVFQTAREVGVHPLQYMGALMTSERLLRTAEPTARFNEILRIAEQYGVPLREIINRSVGEEILKAPTNGQGQRRQPDERDGRIARLEKQRQDDMEASQAREIQTFSQGKEFFEDVRVAMGNIIETGEATSLQDAYDKACWMHPEVRKVLLAREKQEKKDEDLKKRQAAARGVSLVADEGLEVEKGEREDESTEDTVRRAWAASVAGRV